MNNQENKLQTFLTSPRVLTILTVCVAVLLAIYLLISATTKNTGQSQQTVTPTGTPNGGSYATNPNLITSDLYFMKNTKTNTVYINVKTPQPISGLQLALSYSPDAIMGVSLTPGDFFYQPTVLQNSVNQTDGTIHYTLAIPPGTAQISGEGTVAIIHYKPVQAGTSTRLSILPQTKITSTGVNDSVLNKVNSITLP